MLPVPNQGTIPQTAGRLEQVMSNGNPGSCRTRLLSLVAFASVVSLGTGCAAARPERVSPDEIPALEARLAREPRNADVLLRYAAALFASGQCDTATAVARTGMGRDAKSAIGPLVVGQCYERQQEWDQALKVYRNCLKLFEELFGESPTPATRQLHQAIMADESIECQGE